eukprot:scaffold325819_cov83-Attheya_sp.AAC.1
MKFLGNRTRTQDDIHKEFEKKRNVRGNISFCNAGRRGDSDARYNQMVPLDMEATAELMSNTMITIHGANKVKTFFCCTPTEYTQNKFYYGKLHDVTSLEWTQLMVYYANRLSNLLFHQPIEDKTQGLHPSLVLS